jgi:membrane dipeptidase
MSRHWALVCTAAASAAFLLTSCALDAQGDLMARARALHSQVPLVDGHNDYPWALREANVDLDLSRLDIRVPQPRLMTDIPRLRAGGVGAQFWSVYVPVAMQGQAAVRATLEQIDVVHRMMGKYADIFELAGTAADVRRIFASGRIASLIGMEGGHSIDNSLSALRTFYRLGARYMTLTHSSNVRWADSGTDKPALGGLSPFGEEVVREMNRLGMLVDLSHTSPGTMEDAIRVSEAPVIFSHSNARGLHDHARNVPDAVLRLLPKNGGIVMVTFVPAFLSAEVNAWEGRSVPILQELRSKYPDDPARVRAGIDAWRRANPEPRASLTAVADHMDHVRKIAGADHVGIGSDFDGITSTPAGLEDVSTYPALTAELLRRGWPEDEVKKALGLNALRVLGQAEQVAARLQKTREPSTATIDLLDK